MSSRIYAEVSGYSEYFTEREAGRLVEDGGMWGSSISRARASVFTILKKFVSVTSSDDGYSACLSTKFQRLKQAQMFYMRKGIFFCCTSFSKQISPCQPHSYQKQRWLLFLVECWLRAFSTMGLSKGHLLIHGHSRLIWLARCRPDGFICPAIYAYPSTTPGHHRRRPVIRWFTQLACCLNLLAYLRRADDFRIYPVYLMAYPMAILSGRPFWWLFYT